MRVRVARIHCAAAQAAPECVVRIATGLDMDPRDKCTAVRFSIPQARHQRRPPYSVVMRGRLPRIHRAAAQGFSGDPARIGTGLGMDPRDRRGGDETGKGPPRFRVPDGACRENAWQRAVLQRNCQCGTGQQCDTRGGDEVGMDLSRFRVPEAPAVRTAGTSALPCLRTGPVCAGFSRGAVPVPPAAGPSAGRARPCRSSSTGSPPRRNSAAAA